MWACPKCHESLEDQFDSCWKCAGVGQKRDGMLNHWHEPVSTKKAIAIWLTAGIFVLLVSLLLVLPGLAKGIESNDTLAGYYPYAFLSFYLFSSESVLFLLILIQFPVYGVFFGWAWSKHREFWAAFWLLGTHVVLGFSAHLLHKVDYFVNRGINPFSP
jgi:hypothetical protein